MTRGCVLVLLALAVLCRPAAAAADPPQCSGGTVSMMPNQPKTLAFPNCDGAGDNPVVTIATPPTDGTVTGNPFVYTPAAGFVGVDHFRYTVKNTATGETSAPATVNLVVDTAPACGDATATTGVGQPLRIAFSAFPCSDADGGTLFIHTNDAAHGTVVSEFGALEVIYTPEPGFEGTDEFTFYGSDSVSLNTATRTMRVTVARPAQPTPAPTPVTPGETPPPPRPLSADTTAPKTTAKAASSSIAKGVSLTLASNEGGMAKLTLSVDKATARKLKLDRKAKGAVTIGTGTSKLVNGSVKCTVKLTAKARKALKRVSKLKARLTVVATDAAGNSTTTTVALLLKR
jgi:Big-like domain-containing protein